MPPAVTLGPLRALGSGGWVRLAYLGGAPVVAEVAFETDGVAWAAHVILVPGSGEVAAARSSRFPRRVEGRRAFWCRRCPRLFFQEGLLAAHRYEVHGYGAKRKHARGPVKVRRCTLCTPEVTFGSTRARRDHYRRHHLLPTLKARAKAARPGRASDDDESTALTLRSFRGPD